MRLAGFTSSLRLRDVRFVGCDLSNAVIRNLDATRVEFLNCRLVGLVANASRLQSVLFNTCNARFAQFSESRLRHCDFRSTHLGDSVLTRAELAETRLTETILRLADLTGIRFDALDLRNCEIEGLQLRIEDLRGARVTAAQAIDLARLMGVVID